MFFKKKKERINRLKKANEVLMQKHQTNTALVYLFSTYRELSMNIVAAHEQNMNYIPYSEWEAQLNVNLFAVDVDEQTSSIRDALKRDLRRLAESLDFTQENANGFLFKSSANIANAKEGSDK